MVRFSLALIILGAVGLTFAQTIENRDYRLSVDVELVQLPVSVVDKHSLPVRGLPQEFFSVYEDKVLQNISLFKQEDMPLSICLVIDVSGSMLDKLNKLKAAVATFMRASNPDDEFAIVSFGGDVTLEQDFNGNKSSLTRALNDMPNNHGTALYDAVFLSSKYLAHNGSRETKVMLLVTDGEDNNSKYDLKQVLRAIGESKITVYTVGLLGFSGYDDTPKKSLQQLADVTGGAAFFPKKVSDVEEICTKIARDLRNQYTIGYRPTNRNLDGLWRKVVVRLNAPKNTPNLKVRTKQGYYAPDVKRDPERDILK